MLARCQFGINSENRCGATFTYPIKGYPWRRNVMKSYEFEISNDTISLLFNEVYRIAKEYSEDCLNNKLLWNDHSEKGNGITRDKETGTLCHTIGIFTGYADTEIYYAIREDSLALTSSALFKIISQLIEPYETLSATHSSGRG